MSFGPSIGLLGGSFDPVHHGHLRSALDVGNALGLQNIHLMPTYISPHKTQNHATNEQRLAMLNLAVKYSPQLSVDEQEINQPQRSYTVDTLTALRLQYPNQPLCFLMGMDSLLSFTQWHRWQDILSLCHLVVSVRPGWSLPTGDGDVAQLLQQHQTQHPDKLHQQLNGLILIHQVHPLSISSSEIRALRAQGQSCQFLVPENVNQYILDQQLYC